MRIDPQWLDSVLAVYNLSTRDTFEVDGVEIDLPVAASGNVHRPRQWQRRVLPDLIPDSVNADAPERTLFRLLHSFTTSQGTTAYIDDALAGELAPLEDLFRAETSNSKKKKMTLGFHVLAVKAAHAEEFSAKGYTERTLTLLCRRADGSLELDLMRELIEQFRRAPDQLDLAQRTLLNKLRPGWLPSHEPLFSPPESAQAPELPFDSAAGALFQQDVRSLLHANLPSADFFHQLNLLLNLHLGLYQPRLAALLNPQMEYLLAEMAESNPRNRRDLEARCAEFAGRHPFTAQLKCRAPDPELRALTLHAPARVSFEELSKSLAIFHFNILLLVQLRRLGEAYFAARCGRLPAWRAGRLDAETASALAAHVRGPREFLHDLATDPAYAAFLHKALAVLAVWFTKQQIAETDYQATIEELRRAPSALHALRKLYERYNLQSGSTTSRANKQGIGITSSLLRLGQYGLIQVRHRVGAYFEVGVGLLPLLIVLAVGPGREKVPINAFWARLDTCGLSFDPEERQLLLDRLRSMGVYERYSDAGEAAYVRNLMITTRVT